jgi:predicted ATP-grasp superfamily ATP-dependent carboligase
MDTILLVGASVRAAAFSAIRAGLRPWAIDLFADRDLTAVCPATAIPGRQYPAALADLARKAPPGPWLYTGAIENWPAVVDEIARDRPLWGNDAVCLRRVRDPFALADALRAADLPSPAVNSPDERVTGQWVIKPIASGGGTGIRFVTGENSGRLRDPARPAYQQEFIDGESRGGVFVADASGSTLLGVTRQLVGELWVHAPPFRYAGNIGPVVLSPAEQAAWERLGTAVSVFAGLRGLFGIDAVMRDGLPWPVEVNPRYTASVEVLEYATGMRAMALHRAVFDGCHAHGFAWARLEAPCPRKAVGMAPEQIAIVGKAIWYAPRPLTVPADGPWDVEMCRLPDVASLPAFADIPPAGQRIATGRPVLTMFATGTSADECRRRLQSVAGELDAWLLR